MMSSNSYSSSQIQTPDWVKHGVFYQIFPDRFARGVRSELPPGITLKPWGSPPEEQGFQGGDLFGIIERLDYLQDLGVTALYLNPIFSSASNHRYHTYDFLTVDPLLGGNVAYQRLIEAVHARGMRVVLDGVFNHASRGFWPFHHVLENGPASPYVDWFLIHDWPLNPYPPDGETPINYGAWWGLPALPKLNVANPGVREYLLRVAAHWIVLGADGWRLDVPEEISDESFWQEFRTVVKQIDPEAYLVGEIWNDAHQWLQGDRFDGVMNYVFSRAALGYFGAETVRTDYKPGGFKLKPLTAKEFAREVERMYCDYDWQVAQAQLNVLDSHDTARALWILRGDLAALRLCVLFQMTMPGAPCIYYGDEIGLCAASDPYCREAFPWQAETEWDTDLLAFYRDVIRMRHEHRVLRTGTVETVYAHEQVYVCARIDGDQSALICFNAGNNPVTVTLELPASHQCTRYAAVWGRGEYTCSNGRLENVRLPARDAFVLLADVTADNVGSE